MQPASRDEIFALAFLLWPCNEAEKAATQRGRYTMHEDSSGLDLQHLEVANATACDGGGTSLHSPERCCVLHSTARSFASGQD